MDTKGIKKENISPKICLYYFDKYINYNFFMNYYYQQYDKVNKVCALIFNKTPSV